MLYFLVTAQHAQKAPVAQIFASLKEARAFCAKLRENGYINVICNTEDEGR